VSVSPDVDDQAIAHAAYIAGDSLVDKIWEVSGEHGNTDVEIVNIAIKEEEN
jgi:hypothetical protein